jgi:peptide deformylase
MALQPIRKYGDPILRKKAAAVDDFGAGLQQLFVDMMDTMQAEQGIGLAANQIGRPESMCVIDQGMIDESDYRSRRTADTDNGEDQPEAAPDSDRGHGPAAALSPGGGAGAKPVRAFVNPRIVEESREQDDLEEGCLSIPEVREDVTRKLSIRVHYQDLDGRKHEEVFHNMFARVLQHEIDHLNGTFFVDRLSSMRRKLLSKKLKAIAEEAQQEALERKQQRAAVE